MSLNKIEFEAIKKNGEKLNENIESTVDPVIYFYLFVTSNLLGKLNHFHKFGNLLHTLF